MTFANPLLLLALLVIPAGYVAARLLRRRQMRYAVRFTNLDLLATVAGRRTWRTAVPIALFVIALATLVAGLARPRVSTLVAERGSMVILVIDASRSMQAQDVKPSRLAAAQAAARTFVKQVPKDLFLGLVVFAGEAQVGTPPTKDHDLVLEGIDSVTSYSGFGGTAIGDAIVRAVELAQPPAANAQDVRTLAGVQAQQQDEERPSGARGSVSVLFLSDGRQNRGIIPALDGARRARTAGIPVFTVALGTRNATLPGGFGPTPGFDPSLGGGFGFGQPNLSPDPATLRSIARITGGQFFRAQSAKSLEAAYRKLGSRLGRKPGKTDVAYAFIAGAIGLLVAASMLARRWSPSLP